MQWVSSSPSVRRLRSWPGMSFGGFTKRFGPTGRACVGSIERETGYSLVRAPARSLQLLALCIELLRNKLEVIPRVHTPTWMLLTLTFNRKSEEVSEMLDQSLAMRYG
jgi:hypothetical protein